jgi:hypothetical protein
MSGGGLRHRLTRAEVLAEERLAGMIHVTEFHAFLARLQVEFDRVLPGHRRELAEALERAAEAVEERGRA